MHMSDALLSPAVGITMGVVSGACMSYSVARIKKDDLCEKRVPVMGVMGAFVFAAQMINFTIPATGSSGHIGGGVLLAALLGGFPALLSVAAVLIIQCLFFADGGLLALGCNIFNLGVVPCLIVYPLLYKPLLKGRVTAARITAASLAAVVVSLQLGSLGVVLQTQLSGIVELPMSSFALLMQPIHLAIGIVEGIITAAVLCYVYKARPEIIESSLEGEAIESGVPMKNVLVVLVVATIVVGGALSLFASAYPDGLEWSMEKVAGTSELETKDSPVLEGAAEIQEKTAFMPDYDFKSADGEGSGIGTSVAGMVGGAVTFLAAGISALIISLIKRGGKGRTA